MICNGQNECGHHIEGFELLLQKKIQTDCHNYCITHHTYLFKQFALKNASESAGKERNSALIQKNGYEAENNTVAESCTENDGINKVESTFDEKY